MLTQYLRKASTHEPYATLVAYKTENGNILFGYSKYAKKLEDLPFSKKDGVYFANMNSTKDIILFKSKSRNKIDRKNAVNAKFLIIPISIEKEAIKFLQRATKYFKKAPDNVIIYFDPEVYEPSSSCDDYKEKTVNFLEEHVHDKKELLNFLIRFM